MEMIGVVLLFVNVYINIKLYFYINIYYTKWIRVKEIEMMMIIIVMI